MLTIALAAGGLLLLTWVVYPLVMRGLASLTTEASSAAPSMWPKVTAVVATREEPSLVEARVRDLLAADYPADRLDVVVAIDASRGPAPADHPAASSCVTVVRGDAPGGKAAALNAAVRSATGDVLVFTDTHQRFDAGAVRALVVALADGKFGVVSGQLELPEGRRRSPVEHYWRLERRLRDDEARVGSAIGVSGSIYAMRHDLWSPLPAGLILDDLYVPMRLILAGHRVGFTSRARAFDARRTDTEQEFRRKVRTLTGNFQLCAWLPGVLAPWRNPVWAQFLLHKLLRLLTPWLVLAIGGTLLGLATSVRGWALPVVLVVAGALVAGSLLSALRVPGVVQIARWLAMMLAAVVVATYYGLLGRWDVWPRR